MAEAPLLCLNLFFAEKSLAVARLMDIILMGVSKLQVLYSFLNSYNNQLSTQSNSSYCLVL